MYRAEINVMLRPAILDVQGKAVENAIHSLGLASVGRVRIGKHITLQINTTNQSEAESIARDLSERLLSNPVIEDFDLVVTQENAEVLP